MDVVKRTTYDLCLNVEEVKHLLPIITTGIKNAPPSGYDMKRAAPVIEKINIFVRSYGKDVLEREGDLSPELRRSNLHREGDDSLTETEKKPTKKE